MANNMTQNLTLIFVAACLTLVGAANLQEINCKDKYGDLCSRYGARYDAQEIASQAEQMIYISIGVTLAVLIAIAVIITTCLFCACCPVYKFRHKEGTVYASTTTQRQPVTLYQQPYNPQQVNIQPSLQPPYPGFIYSPGPAVTQTHNAPYYGAVTEHQGSPVIGNFAGAPEGPPAYYQTSPNNQNINANFTSK